MRKNSIKLLGILLAISWILRIWNLDIPQAYIFDEVYHVPAIRAISQGNRDAYNPFAKAPEPNTAYDWLHPPLAKLIQAGSVRLLGDNSFGWRFPAAIFGTISIAALYYLALVLFKDPRLALIAAAFFAFDNLQLTMSRIAMNDIFVTTWIILALAFFYRFLKGPVFLKGLSFAPAKVSPYWSLFLTGLFTGLALATKHSAVLLYPVFIVFFLQRSVLAKQGRTLLDNIFHSFVFLVVLPVIIYFLSYSQLFILGGNLKDFIDLHKQIFWYQTHLTATHGYQSTAWQWSLLIRPVWFYVQYFKDSVANIYNLGNPAVFWGGVLSVIYFIFRFLQGLTFYKRSDLLRLKGLSFALAKVSPYWYLLISYLSLFLPFVFSPRIMFLHHYLPALPFLCLITARVIYKNKLLVTSYLLLITIIFIFFYPLNTAIPIPTNLVKYWFWLPTWR